MTTCSNSSGGGMVTVSLSLDPGGLSELSSEGVKVGPSVPEGLGGRCFSWGFSGGSLSVRGRVPARCWE